MSARFSCDEGANGRRVGLTSSLDKEEREVDYSHLQ